MQEIWGRRLLCLSMKWDFKMLCAFCISLGCQDRTVCHCKPCRHACITRDSAVLRWPCMCLWRSRLAEHYFACLRQCVSACVVCSWQTYCTSVKMQAATWSTVNSMYPSSPVHHSSSLTIAQSPTSNNTHSPIHVVLVANIVQWWIVEVFELQWCAVTVTIIQTLEDWRVIELWPVMEFLHLCIWKLKFTFAYCKWSLIYLQHVRTVSAVLSLSNTFTVS